MHRRARPFPGGFASEEEADRWEKAKFEELSRFIANWCGAWDECGREPCVRSRRCRGAGAPCFDRLSGIFYELLSDAPHARQLFEIAIEAYEDSAVAE